MATTLGIVEVPATGRDGNRREITQRGVAPSHSSLPLLAARRFGNKSLLDWVVRRVTESLLLDRVAIVTDDRQGSAIQRLAPADVPVFVGDQRDSLGRVAAAMEAFQADQLVRVPLCCPFIDPEMIDRLVSTAAANSTCDYVGYFSMDGRPAVLSKVGLFAEWCSSGAIRRANQLADRESDRADSLQFVLTRADLFQLRFIPIPERLEGSEVQLKLEADADWEVADMIVEALGPDQLDWRRIVGFLEQQPALRQRLGVSALLAENQRHG